MAGSTSAMRRSAASIRSRGVTSPRFRRRTASVAVSRHSSSWGDDMEPGYCGHELWSARTSFFRKDVFRKSWAGSTGRSRPADDQRMLSDLAYGAPNGLRQTNLRKISAFQQLSIRTLTRVAPDTRTRIEELAHENGFLAAISYARQQAAPLMMTIGRAAGAQTPRSLAERLADYAAQIRYEDLGASTVERVKSHFIDTLGCGLAALDEPAVRRVMSR